MLGIDRPFISSTKNITLIHPTANTDRISVLSHNIAQVGGIPNNFRPTSQNLPLLVKIPIVNSHRKDDFVMPADRSTSRAFRGTKGWPVKIHCRSPPHD